MSNMSETNEYSIRELTPELLEDYLSFFDREAFADNPKWASCYCYFPHAPHATEEWHERTGEQNRAAVCRLIADGRMHGYLAYQGGKPIAWCNVGPRTRVTILDEVRDVDARTIASIVCFIVAKAHRGRGVARRLLEAVCAGLKNEGYEFIEAYPRKDAQDEASNHYGPLRMYRAAGFEVFAETGESVIVRKRLS